MEENIWQPHQLENQPQGRALQQDCITNPTHIGLATSRPSYTRRIGQSDPGNAWTAVCAQTASRLSMHGGRRRKGRWRSLSVLSQCSTIVVVRTMAKQISDLVNNEKALKELRAEFAKNKGKYVAASSEGGYGGFGSGSSVSGYDKPDDSGFRFSLSLSPLSLSLSLSLFSLCFLLSLTSFAL